ncbi:SAM-dependent methyltransferase [Lipingzhangella sp. LS1_29]|uniref:SAM-dependent methyltransferase n=1 Tax=Lipingzhangella rawalii TaxID=2055835 RepID=A0ABU2H1N9_9ACTN|nr:SAM-dependent methyltransferase [Lipingzhangella rawalii]MDS1268785.1 SAM-dependent methyltransferase [Lipingzhangella rawalii]
MSQSPRWIDSDPDFPPELNSKVAHPARVWDYWLGGKDNFAADRAAGDQLSAAIPDWIPIVRADREFLARVVSHAVTSAGISHFLDIGTGVPTANNTHEVAQRLDPAARVVYVDNDPIVLVHARALLTSTEQGATDYVDADLRDPERILNAAARTLDLGQPVLVTLLGIMEFIPDDAEARSIVERLLGDLAPGSLLAMTHPLTGTVMDQAMRLWNDSGATPVTVRSQSAVRELFAGVDLLDPGLVSLPQWRPTPQTAHTDRDLPFYCAVGRKP